MKVVLQGQLFDHALRFADAQQVSCALGLQQLTSTCKKRERLLLGQCPPTLASSILEQNSAVHFINCFFLVLNSVGILEVSQKVLLPAKLRHLLFTYLSLLLSLIFFDVHYLHNAASEVPIFNNIGLFFESPTIRRIEHSVLSSIF
jgi:hypothetical protein